MEDEDSDSDDDDEFVDNIHYTVYALRKTSTNRHKAHTDDNPTLDRAMKTSWGRWEPIVMKEMTSAVEKGTGVPILKEDIPPEFAKGILRGKMNLITKYLPSGQHDKDKARLVAMDCFDDTPPSSYTYAPTGSDKAYKIMLQIGVTMKLTRVGLDFSSAFLSATLPFRKFLLLPKQFRDENGNRIYWELMKALYGMRESGYLFSEEVRRALIAGGWKQSVSDPSVYTKKFSNGEIGLLFTYVDDQSLWASSMRVLQAIMTNPHLHRQFKYGDGGG